MPTNAQISRYSRQILVPAIGIAGQSGLLNSKVLVIGAGGLGSPCILYLAAAGVGHIGVVDYDTVEISNLQRQIIHSETRIGLKKCESALTAIRNLNSDIIAVAYDVVLSSSNAKQIVAEYDIVCDCSDNVATRYLVNDVCVLLGKPLVSGGALRMDGQLTVYNYKGSPCYRCLFPTPPDPSTVTNCSDGGVLGVVTGIIGSAQALEVIRIITGMNKGDRHRMLVFDAQEMAFRTIKLRPRNRNCAICGDSPTITDVIDYIKFCGSSANDIATPLNILDDFDRITCQNYKSLEDSNHLLLDVREKVQFDICALPGSVRILSIKTDFPLDDFKLRMNELILKLEGRTVFVVCRRGNDSQQAVKILKEHSIIAKDIIGGLEEWSKSIDSNFPTY